MQICLFSRNPSKPLEDEGEMRLGAEVNASLFRCDPLRQDSGLLKREMCLFHFRKLRDAFALLPSTSWTLLPPAAHQTCLH